MRTNARLGYGMAVAAAAISGLSIYVNSLGVGSVIKDATLYTTLKNAVVGVIVLIPLVFLASERRQFARLSARQWLWLVALAVVGGSVAYVLFFEGLRLTTASTGSLINHLQFAFVALLAIAFLRERMPALAWAGVALLVLASFLGVRFDAMRFGEGALLVLASTVMFAGGFVIAKHLLNGLSVQAVMAAKMTGGAIILAAYAALTGHLRPLSHLSIVQWEWVVLTGIILFAFTATILLAIRHAPVTAVLAIGAAAPLITLALQSAGGRAPAVSGAAALSLALTAAAALVIAIGGTWSRSRRAVA